MFSYSTGVDSEIFEGMQTLYENESSGICVSMPLEYKGVKPCPC